MVKVNTCVTIESDLKDYAKAKGLVISQVLETALKQSLDMKEELKFTELPEINAKIVALQCRAKALTAVKKKKVDKGAFLRELNKRGD